MSNDNNNNSNTRGRFADVKFDAPVNFARLTAEIMRQAEQHGEEKQDLGVYLIHAAMIACDVVKAGGEIDWSVPKVALKEMIKEELSNVIPFPTNTPESA